MEHVLQNVCPNCGGGFVNRPFRPSKNWKGDNYLGKDPASTTKMMTAYLVTLLAQKDPKVLEEIQGALQGRV